MLANRLYRDGSLEASDFDPALISDFLDEKDTFVWCNLVSPSASDLDMLIEEFQLHPLAVEDATHPHQRPKLDVYPTHSFAVLYDLWVENGSLQSSEVNVFIGERFFVTVSKDGKWSYESVVERWDLDSSKAEHGVGYLLYHLLDSIIDRYFSAADKLGDMTEEIEDMLFDSGKGDGQQQLYHLRKQLVAARRLLAPLREVIAAILRKDSFAVDEEMHPYFQDVYDHVLRVSESIDMSRELLTTALEVHLSVSSNRLNEIMKKVTSWAAILAVCTAIFGMYGMNYPLLPRADASYFGFLFAVAVVVFSSFGLYLYFKRKDWL